MSLSAAALRYFLHSGALAAIRTNRNGHLLATPFRKKRLPFKKICCILFHLI